MFYLLIVHWSISIEESYGEYGCVWYLQKTSSSYLSRVARHEGEAFLGRGSWQGICHCRGLTTLSHLIRRFLVLMVVRFLFVFCSLGLQPEETSGFTYELGRDIERLQKQLQGHSADCSHNHTRLRSEQVDSGIQTIDSERISGTYTWQHTWQCLGWFWI